MSFKANGCPSCLEKKTEAGNAKVVGPVQPVVSVPPVVAEPAAKKPAEPAAVETAPEVPVAEPAVPA